MRSLTVIALLCLGACTRPSAPTAESNGSGGPAAEGSAAAVEAVQPSAVVDQCAQLRRDLEGGAPPTEETPDPADLALRIANAEGPSWALIAAEARLVGASAPVAAALQARIASGDDATLRAAFRALTFADPAALVSTARTMVADSTLAMPARYIAADALARSGHDGLEALTSLLSAQTGDDLDRVVTAGLRGALQHPLVAREVLFAADGACITLDRPICRRLARRLLPVDAELAGRLANAGPNGALVAAQFAAESDSAELSAWVLAASRPDADPVAVMTSFAELSPWVEPTLLVPVVRALLRSPELESLDRRGLARWLFTNAGRIEVDAQTLEGLDDPATQVAVAGAVVASGGELPDELVALMSAAAAGTSVDARFAALVVAAATGHIPAGASETDAAMLAQVAARDVAGLLNAQYGTALAVDGALLAARGDRAALAAAIAAAPPSANTLRLAAVALAPDAALAERLEPVLGEALNASTGRWMAASGRTEAVTTAIAATLLQPAGSATPGAIEAARAADVAAPRDALVRLLSSEPTSLWVEPIGVREVAAELAMENETITAGEVLEMRARTAASGVGGDSVGLLGMAVLLRCEAARP